MTKNDQKWLIKQVAVLGAGVMGAQIAAHLANCGFAVLLYDLKDVDNAIQHLHRLKPKPFASSDCQTALTPCTYEKGLSRLSECQLVIEAVAERMDIKRDLYQKIIPHLAKQAVLATNTSGLSVTELAGHLPAELQSRFCGVHFFNPPRYLPLVELIPHASTAPQVMDDLETFLVRKLGKTIVRAKDTPNFIANRIGVFAWLSVVKLAERYELPFEVVDALTGLLIGRPKSATFRTMDVVGLDTVAHVIDTMAAQLKDDPWHSYYQPSEWLLALIQQGALGQKSGAGIYKKHDGAIWVLDRTTMEYRPADKKPAAEVLALIDFAKPQQTFAALRDSKHPEAQFVWELHRELWHYCAFHGAEIATSVADIDTAMRNGFAWQYGPFASWQAADWSSQVSEIEKAIANKQSLASAPLPAWVKDISAVYQDNASFTFQQQKLLAAKRLPVYQRQLTQGMSLEAIAKFGTTIFEDDSIRLWHLQDDIGILSFKTSGNVVGRGVLEGILNAVDYAERKLQGLVLWQGSPTNFCLGANLKEFFPLFEAGKVTSIIDIVANFQQSALALRHCQVPTVAALRGRAFGGGCELVMHCDRVVAAQESYIGLVEIAVGLLPAGGGCHEFSRRAAKAAIGQDSEKALQHYFSTVAEAKVSSSAMEAKQLGYLREQDVVVANPEEVLFIALEQAKALSAANYQPPLPERFKAGGEAMIANLSAALVNYREGQFVSEYDFYLAERIATVMAGGQVAPGSEVDAAWILKLEREAFAEFATQAKSQARIKAMLETGKPLRN